MLETHLAEAPRDVDARLLYGLVLSWEGRYDEARPVLQQVLTQAPAYTDARVALMNVEYWSGHSPEALDQADRILAGQPGNVTARAVRDRIDAANRPWWAATTYTVDAFDDGTDPWQEASASLTRRTAVGSLIMRWSHAERFGLRDNFFEAEFYPRFRPGTYAFVGLGVAPESEPSLYPQYRVAFDLYQSFGRGFEVSGGARYMDFAAPLTKIYVATLTKLRRQLDVDRKDLTSPARRRSIRTATSAVPPLFRRRRTSHLGSTTVTASAVKIRSRGSGHVQLRYGPGRIRLPPRIAHAPLRRCRREPPGASHPLARLADDDQRRPFSAVLT
jgi:hypothetical protein